MTTDTLAGAEETGEHDGDTPFAPVSDAASRSYLVVSVVFLALSLLGGLVLAIQLVVPDFLAGVAALSYGRLQPLSTHLFVYGWLTIGLLGAVLYSVPRATRAELASHGRARAALGLLVVGYGAGAVGIALGFSEGRRLLEAPLWADAVVLVGLLAVASVVIATVRKAPDLGPVHWYAVAATGWIVLLHVAGNLPGLTGVSAAMQTSFYRAGLTGLWVAAAGVGVVYYLLPRITGRTVLEPTQMSVIGLWSLAFLWVLTAPADLTYGPTPDWLDTLSVLFAIAMVIPVGVIFADIVTAMRGRWNAVSETTAMRYVMAGAVAFALLPIVNLLLALRSSSAVLGFTDWIAGYEFIGFGGAATFWLLGYAAVAAPDLGRGRPAGLRWQYRTTVFGVVVFAGTLLFSGAQAGLIWLGAANSDVFANAGEGFRNTVTGLEGAYVVRLVGFALYAIGLIWFVTGVLGRPGGPEPAGQSVSDDGTAEPPGIAPELALARPLGLGRLVTNAVVLFGIAVALVWVLPSLEGGLGEPTLLADEARNYDGADQVAQGREVYLREGCYFCHTQAVRPIVTDVGLGAVSLGGDYAHETPPLIGFQRIGPDLMHVGGRSIDAVAADLAGPVGDPAEFVAEAATQVAAFVASHLRDPREARPWSTMPAYEYLSDSDMDALVAYIAGLD